jgi:photosystem II stability/assembly factor-like uncharacterized protein
MKNLLVVFVLLINSLTANLLMAQPVWDFQINPMPVGPILGKVQFVSASEGWISAGNGSLLHTVNGGATWTIVTPFPDDMVSTISDPAFSMSWINQTHGWILTSRGTGFNDANGAIVQKTIDGGKTWTKKELPKTDPSSLPVENAGNSGDVGAQVQFVDENNGWATTFNIYTHIGQIYKTADGGNNWSFVKNLPATDEATVLYFIDKNNGWMLSINDKPALFEILKTSDGGATWISQYTDATKNSDTLTSSGAIQFTDFNNGWAAGPNGRILKTINGGSSWKLVNNTGIDNKSYSKCLFFLNANIGWIGTNVAGTNELPTQRLILHTKDGGASWSQQKITSSDAIFSIFFRDETNGWFTADKCVQNCNLPDSLKIYTGVIGHTGYPAGLESLDSDSKINIYPNPSGNTLFIKGATANSIALVIDLNGKQLIQKQSIKDQIDISNLAKGVYILQMINKEGITFRKFIKQ